MTKLYGSRIIETQEKKRKDKLEVTWIYAKSIAGFKKFAENEGYSEKEIKDFLQTKLIKTKTTTKNG